MALRTWRILTVLVACAGGALAAPYYSIDYLYHDIALAKSHGHRIYEVRARSSAFQRLDTITEARGGCAVDCADSLHSIVGVYRIEFDVIANLAGSEFPASIPLVVFDRRPQARRVWRNRSGNGIQREHGGGETVIVVDARGRLVAMYNEASLIPGDDPAGKATKEQIRQGTFALMDAQEYHDFIDRTSLARVLLKSGVLAW